MFCCEDVELLLFELFVWSDVSVIVCLIDSGGDTFVLEPFPVADELAILLELAPFIAAWSIGVEVCCRILRLVEESGGDVEPTDEEDEADEETEDEEELLFVELLLLLLLLLFRLETVTSFCGELP